MEDTAVLTAIGELKGQIGELNGQMSGIGREIRDLKDGLNKKDDCCRTCRSEIDDKIETIKTTVTKSEGVQIGKAGTIALIFASIGGVYGIVMVAIAIWKFFVHGG
jgi:hypothetical protein